MVHFPEDDEIEQLQKEYAKAEQGYDDFMRDHSHLDERRRTLKMKVQQATIDPVVKKLVESAKNEGHALGANEALANRIKFLEKRIAVRDTEIERLNEEVNRTSDYDEWVESSAEWERKYKQLKNSRRSR